MKEESELKQKSVDKNSWFPHLWTYIAIFIWDQSKKNVLIPTKVSMADICFKIPNIQIGDAQTLTIIFFGRSMHYEL